jgi:RNA polymerase sigma factor (sigma-70 family)
MAALDPADRSDPTVKRITLDERFFAALLSETPQDRLEAQELRQLVHQALMGLSPEELRVIELRFQHKKSPGQVAAQLNLARSELRSLERQALAKLRRHLHDWR